MSTLKEIEIKNIDHLGIVAGIIDSIGLVEIVNSLVGEAKRLVSTIDDSELVKSQIHGYSYVVKESSYADIQQRWLIVQSESRNKSDLRQLEKRIQKSEISAISQLKKLQR